MRKLILLMCLVLLITEISQAAILTFDDITTGPILGYIPDDYGGFNWNSEWGIVSSSNNPGSGYDNGTVSGEYVAFNLYYDDVTITRDSVFDFQGVYLTAAWDNGLNITIDGYLDSSLEYTTTVIVDTTGPTLFDLNYLGIDKLEFTAFGGTDAGLGGNGSYFAMDNFTFVPEPNTFALISFGVVVLLKRIKK